MSASIKAGLRAVAGDSGGIMIFLGDMPYVSAPLARRVLKALRDGAVAAQPRFRDQPARPVGLSSVLYASLMTLTGDVGAGALLENDPRVVRLNTAQPGAVYDVDVRGGAARHE